MPFNFPFLRGPLTVFHHHQVRDGIAELAGTREDNSIADILDVDFIKQRIDGGTYAFGDAARLIQQVMVIILRVQAPRRDEETKGKWAAFEAKVAAATIDTAARITCEGLELLLDRVNAMRIDAANARFVWPASPYLHHHHIFTITITIFTITITIFTITISSPSPTNTPHHHPGSG
jgi:hypothetical protein